MRPVDTSAFEGNVPHAIAATGYIGNTDFDWYTHFLRRQEPPEEVNFWQPSAHGFAVLEPGAPFFFRLKSPHNAIAGFGFFSRYEKVPAWLAWESFRDLNGATSLAEMTARIERYRASRRQENVDTPGAQRPGDYEIGCIMISQPVFFAPDDWVRDDAGWKRNIVAGKGIELLHGEGQRILSDCLARLQTVAGDTAAPEDAYSTPSRTPIPRQAEQAFHAKPNRHSTASRTAIPRQAEQFRGCGVESLAGQ